VFQPTVSFPVSPRVDFTKGHFSTFPTHGCTQDPQILEKAKGDSETGGCAEESTGFGDISK